MADDSPADLLTEAVLTWWGNLLGWDGLLLEEVGDHFNTACEQAEQFGGGSSWGHAFEAMTGMIFARTHSTPEAAIAQVSSWLTRLQPIPGHPVAVSFYWAPYWGIPDLETWWTLHWQQRWSPFENGYPELRPYLDLWEGRILAQLLEWWGFPYSAGPNTSAVVHETWARLGSFEPGHPELNFYREWLRSDDPDFWEPEGGDDPEDWRFTDEFKAAMEAHLDAPRHAAESIARTVSAANGWVFEGFGAGRWAALNAALVPPPVIVTP